MIRTATEKDLVQLLDIYAYAREFMRQTGNPNQWGNTTPSAELLEEDIKKEQLYVLEDEEGIYGAFAFFTEPDPTYSYIEGSWKNDSAYGTIHRVASSGRRKGILTEIVDNCYNRIPHLRIDTHADNKVMQGAIAKNGFEYCGVIYLANGSPRLAYEKVS